MLTEEEKQKISKIRALCDEGKEDEVTAADRQWILNIPAMIQAKIAEHTVSRLLSKV